MRRLPRPGPLTALSLLTLVGSLTACGSDRPPERQAAAPVSPVTTSGTPATVPPSSSPGPVTTVTALTFFTTPTRNIACTIGPGMGARCDVQDHSWQAPRKPEDCTLDYGDSLYVGATQAGFACVGDTVRDPAAQVLAYGSTLATSDVRCLSETTGVTCTAVGSTGAAAPGFSVAKATYRLF
ncbi:MAG: hypothetical protein JWL64_1055 [Frankiales bacterium]|nr:hypothetical protein [Frankiales bacterium]